MRQTRIPVLQDMEFKIRSQLNEIYFGKTKDIVNDLRSVDGVGREAAAMAQATLIRDAMKSMRANK